MVKAWEDSTMQNNSNNKKQMAVFLTCIWLLKGVSSDSGLRFYVGNYLAHFGTMFSEMGLSENGFSAVIWSATSIQSVS